MTIYGDSPAEEYNASSAAQRLDFERTKWVTKGIADTFAASLKEK